MDWPTNLPLAGSFDKIDDVVGKPLLYPLVAREPILKRDLGVEGSGIGISGKNSHRHARHCRAVQ